MKRLAHIAKMILVLTVPTLVIIIVLLELAARTILPTSDVPDVLFDPQLGNHFKPNQRGMYIAGLSADIRAAYRINNKGWNSPHDYTSIRETHELRIAVIGDSYVEARQVPYDKSFPYVLEQNLQEISPDCAINVYALGHSGASLAQYTKVAQHAMSSYKPDIIIINVVHNDFLESLETFARIDNWSLRPTEDSFTFIAPQKSTDLEMRRWLRHSALVRYLVVNMKVLDRLYVLKQRVSKTRRFEANIDAGLIQSYIDNGAIEEALAYLLGTLRLVTEEAPLLFVIDGNRRAIYRGDDPRNTHSYRLNQVLREQTSKYNFPLIDLTDRFEKDWKREGKRFDWATDGHWNQRGHWITAEAIRAFITAHQQGYFCNE